MSEIGFYIDPQIEQALSKGDRAVVEKYGFEVRKDGGLITLTDPVVRKANRGKGGHYTGIRVVELLESAVAQRRAADKSMKAPSDKVEKQNARAKADAPKAGSAASTSQTTPVAKPEPDADTSTTPPDKTTGTSTPAVTRGVRASKRGAAKKGSGEKESSKKKEPKQRKDVRYVRAFRAIFARPAITVAQLSKEADLPSKSSAAWLDVWNTAVKVLAEGGKLSVDQATLLSTAETKKETKK